MNKRILSALLAIILLLFTLSSCDVSQFVSDIFSQQDTQEETTAKQEIELPPVTNGSYFEAHFIDVGQADSILVVCDGQAMLIDAGNPDDDDIIIEYLKKYAPEMCDSDALMF